MLVNFRAREINRNARKLTRTPTLITKKKKTMQYNTLINNLITPIYRFPKFLTLNNKNKIDRNNLKLDL
jgi:hypothetical protein